MILTNAQIVLKDKVVNGTLTVENGRITAITESQSFDVNAIDLKGNFIAPGFVDLHTHGAGGYDFMDGSLDDIIKAASAHLKHGTTTLLPTSLTSSDEDLFKFLDNFKIAKSSNTLLPSMPGVHLEGPYFDMVEKGAQDSRYIKRPRKEHYTKIVEKAEGNIARWSIAPELEGSIEMLDELQKEGILFSAAHTAATYEDISKAYDHGLKLLTHFYSGMSTIKREGGFRILGAVESGYLIDELYVELICDGLHLPKSLLELIFKCKRNDRIISCTDSMRGAGCQPGPSILGPKHNGQDVIIEDGIAKMPDRSCFAGSVATGNRLVKTLHKVLGLTLPNALRIASYQPAKLLNLDSEIGSIEKGKTADLVVFDSNIEIKQVFKAGVPVL